MLNLKTTLTNWHFVWSGKLAEAKAGVTRAIDAAAAELQSRLRADTVGAGLGQGIANAWRRERYPQSRDSLNAAGLVWSRAPRIIDAANKGSVIRGRNGFWLAIPLPAAGRAARGKRITPREFEKQRGLDLRFVYLPGRSRALLVADAARVDSRGRAQRRSRYDRAGNFYTPLSGVATVPVFLLVPQARMPKRLDLNRRAGEAAAAVAAQITREL